VVAYRGLFVSLLAFASVIVLANKLLAWRVPGHTFPEQRIRGALAQGGGCVAVAGDSRMFAGILDAEFARALQASGSRACAANLSIGALRLAGVAVAIREYLHRGGAPRALVVGITTDMPIRSEQAEDLSTFTGNAAISLAWSRPEDAARYFPDGWFANPFAFDRRFRFAVARASTLGAYQSLSWQKVQRVQDILTGRESGPRNEFGAVGAMADYGGELQRAAVSRLEEALSRPEDQWLDPWFIEIETSTAARGISLIAVDLPMPEYFQRSVTRTAVAKRFRAWLARRLASRGGALIDLSSPAWLKPSHFSDALHLGGEGAVLFSETLGREVAAVTIKSPR
jgi:hypothetical protein